MIDFYNTYNFDWLIHNYSLVHKQKGNDHEEILLSTDIDFLYSFIYNFVPTFLGNSRLELVRKVRKSVGESWHWHIFFTQGPCSQDELLSLY